MSVKIAALEAENVKRIKAVALTPSPTGLTIVGGNNNQGKTSVLDALAWALGGEKFRPTAAVRDGALAPPHLKVILSNGVVVERKGKNSSLTVTDPTGQRSGQQLLNAFVEPLALDLPRFMQASDKDKADTLLNIIGVGDALTGLDREIKALYDRRTVIGQIGAQKRHAAEELTEYPDAPSEPVSAIELIQQQQEILLHNADNQRKRMKLAQLEEQEKQLGRRVQELSQELEMVEHQCGLRCGAAPHQGAQPVQPDGGPRHPPAQRQKGPAAPGFSLADRPPRALPPGRPCVRGPRRCPADDR